MKILSRKLSREVSLELMVDEDWAPRFERSVDSRATLRGSRNGWHRVGPGMSLELSLKRMDLEP